MLVCWLKNKGDLDILIDEGWYRIPVKTHLTGLNNFRHFAFYQSSVFKNDKFRIKYYGELKKFSVAKRKNLFPQEKLNEKSELEYYKIEIKNLNTLSRPVISKNGRRVIFLKTTREKLLNAAEFNDLFHGSPLEDKLWNNLKKNNLFPERQVFFGNIKRHYCLDFAAFCRDGLLDIECDGDKYHLNKTKAIEDNLRDNFLTSNGWNILRYSSGQLENLKGCLQEIRYTVYSKGGILKSVKDNRIYRSKINSLGYQLPILFGD